MADAAKINEYKYVGAVISAPGSRPDLGSSHQALGYHRNHPGEDGKSFYIDIDNENRKVLRNQKFI